MGTHYKGTKQEQLALETYIKLSRASDAVGTRINHHLQILDLTISQFGVLEALYHIGEMNQKTLAEKILKSTGNMTLVIDNLSKRGLVERHRDEQDRRNINICLTDTGQKLISEFFPKHVAVVVAEMNILTQAEQEQLAQLCKKLGLGCI
jgi:MarR family 2-MHQ and catechol resistance regulon transcriptional repressor